MSLTEVPRIYAIADSVSFRAEQDPAPLVAAIELWAELGIGWIQLRLKNLSDLDQYRIVERCVQAVGERSADLLWINDRVDLAAMFPVFGVHLGQNDLPPSAARAVLGADKKIGYSTHNPRQVASANENDNVDVVAVGPIFTTSSKAQPDPVVGIDGLKRAREGCCKPLVAIGGIETQNVAEVLAAGADSVAVIGALMKLGDGDSKPPTQGRLRENGERLIEASRCS